MTLTWSGKVLRTTDVSTDYVHHCHSDRGRGDQRHLCALRSLKMGTGHRPLMQPAPVQPSCPSIIHTCGYVIHNLALLHLRAIPMFLVPGRFDIRAGSDRKAAEIFPRCLIFGDY